MTKDVLVKITGAHLLEGETENLSVITGGNYYYKNGKHYVIYEELMDEDGGVIRNTIKAGSDEVDIIKSGSTRAHMMFRVHETNVSCYITPYGQMMIGVATDRIRISEEEDKLHIQIDYTLEINYESATQCQIDIEVCSKATAKLNLND